MSSTLGLRGQPFFFPEHKNCSPAKMKPSKRLGYNRVFGILGEHAEYHYVVYCCSCCEWFAKVSGFPDIDNSRKKLSQKIQQLLAKSDGDTSWVFVDLHENIILQDKNSDGKALENITINACEVVQKYLHWKMDETACFFCTVSFILFRSMRIWLQQPVGHILKFVSAARLGNYLHQAQAVAAIMKEVESIGKSGQYDFDALKIALKKKVSSFRTKWKTRINQTYVL